MAPPPSRHVLGFLKIMAVSHTGITTDDFLKFVADWITTRHHPRFNRLYTEMVYQSMIELLSFLRANGFKTFIVSGGDVEFIVSSPSASTAFRRSR
jgi:phosphoserine phosphatase